MVVSINCIDDNNEIGTHAISGKCSWKRTHQMNWIVSFHCDYKNKTAWPLFTHQAKFIHRRNFSGKSTHQKTKVCKSCFGRVHFITIPKTFRAKSMENVRDYWWKMEKVHFDWIRTVDNKRDGRHTDLSALYTIFFYCAIVVCIAEPLASRR